MCWEPCFQQEQDGEDLQAVVTPVNKVAHEDVAGGWHLPPGLEQTEQVMKLPVDVTTHLSCTQLSQICLRNHVWHTTKLTVTGVLTG